MTKPVVALEPSPITINGREWRARKRFLGGTHRCAAPEDTLARAKPHFHVAGITRLADISGLDDIGLTTIVAQRPNAPTLANASGKGFSLVAAQVSAVMEALEIAHAEAIVLPILEGSYDQLSRTHNLLALESLSLTNRAIFRTDQPDAWISGWDLLGQRAVVVPFDTVSMLRNPRRVPVMNQPFQTGSNGLASGNELLEAVAAGLYEVIERDALACQQAAFKHGLDTVRNVDTSTISDPFAHDLLQRLDRHNVDVLVWDYTCDTNVPVFKAAIFDRHDQHRGIFGGYGCHLDPGIAVTRALTEAAQSRAIYIAGSRDDMFRHDARRMRLEDSTIGREHLRAHGALVPMASRPSEACATFEEDVAVLLDRVVAAGITQVIVVDLTRPDVGIPVVRVIAPGLEGYMFQFYSPGPRAEYARKHGIPPVPAPITRTRNVA
jgi:ribosomal protein S12 methylthiotransferase accessory factor